MKIDYELTKSGWLYKTDIDEKKDLVWACGDTPKLDKDVFDILYSLVQFIGFKTTIGTKFAISKKKFDQHKKIVKQRYYCVDRQYWSVSPRQSQSLDSSTG